jgi:hypothetical protein
MQVDGRLPDRLPAPWTRFIREQGHRHDKSLSPRANRGHSKGSNLSCEGSWALCGGASINRMMRAKKFHVERR